MADIKNTIYCPRKSGARPAARGARTLVFMSTWQEKHLHRLGQVQASKLLVCCRRLQAVRRKRAREKIIKNLKKAGCKGKK